MDRGLARIILIDSYMPACAAEVSVSGHTSINGANGAGKTSLLRLVPIFYGEHPRNLVTKTTSGRKSFASYYLPRLGSYLVFEYRGADDGLKMAVFRASAADDAYQQVLIDGAYDETIFLDARAGVILPSADLLPRLKSRGIAHHICQSNDEYRAILLDGTRRDRMRYSMVSRHARLGALVPLVTNMFQRNVSFEHFARIIQDYARNTLSAEAQNNLARFKPNRRLLAQLVEHYDAFSALESLRPRLPELSEALETLHLHRGKRDAAALATLQMDVQLERAIEDLRHEISGKEEELNTQMQAFDNARKAALTHQKEISDQLNEQTSRRDRLAAQKREYEKQELPRKTRELASLPDQQATLAARRQEVERLESDLNGAEGPINMAIAEEQNRAHQAQIHHGKALAGAIADYTDTKDKHSERHRQALRELADRQMTERAGLEQRLRTARESAVRLEALLDNPKVELTVIQRLELAEAIVDAAEQEAAQAASTRDEAIEAYVKAQAHYGRANTQFDKDRDEADDAETQMAKAQQLLAGGPDSLIHFLGEAAPGWTDTLGRLDVGALPAQPLAPDELQRAYEEAVRLHDEAEKRLRKSEAILDEASKVREATKAAADQAKSKADIAARKQREARQSRSEAREAHREAQRQAKARIEADLNAAQQLITQLQSEVASMSDAHGSAREALEHELADTLAILSAEHEARLTALREEYQAREADHRAAMTRLESQRKDAIEKSGVDPKEITRLRNECKALEQRCNELEGFRVLVAAYESFLANEWPGHDEAAAAANTLRAQRDRIHDEINAQQAQWSDKKRQADQAMAALSNTLKAKRAERETLATSAALRSAKENPALDAPDQELRYYLTLHAENLTREYLDQHRQVSTDIDRLQGVVGAFVNAFQRHPGSPSHDYWLKTKAAWAHSDLEPITQARAVQEYFNNNDHSLVRSSLVQSFNYLDILDNYRLAMEEFERGVARFNRQLLAHLEQDLHFDLIDRVEPKITLDLSELDFWKDLRLLAEHYGAWKKSGGRDLPDSTLVKAVEAYSQTIRDDKSNNDDFSALIRFQFRLEIDGSERRARSARDLEDISSNGLSYIVLILLFQGFVDLVRGDHPVTMLWPLDELNAIDAKNRRALLQMLSSHRIALLTATPDLRPIDLAHFAEAYELENHGGRRRLIRMQWAGQRVAPASETPQTDTTEIADE